MLDLAIEQFNQQDFYACHDTLEALWMEAIEPDRSFYQGLLQLAVGLYHFSHHQSYSRLGISNGSIPGKAMAGAD